MCGWFCSHTSARDIMLVGAARIRQCSSNKGANINFDASFFHQGLFVFEGATPAVTIPVSFLRWLLHHHHAQMIGTCVCALPFDIRQANSNAVQVAIGDTVVVTGTVAEFAGLTELTTITAVSKCGCGLLPSHHASSCLSSGPGSALRHGSFAVLFCPFCSTHTLYAIILTTMWLLCCRTGAVVTPLPLTLPTVAQKNAALEPFEGMLVTVAGPLTVTNNFQLGTFGQISLSAKGRVYTGTQVRLSGCHNRVDSGWLIVQFRHQSVCTCTCQYLCWSSSGASKPVHRFCRWLSRVRPLRLWTPASRSLSLTTAAAAATPFPFHILRQVHTGFIRQNFLHLRQQQKTSLHLACSSNSADLRWNVCSCACACTILMLLALPMQSCPTTTRCGPAPPPTASPAS